MKTLRFARWGCVALFAGGCSSGTTLVTGSDGGPRVDASLKDAHVDAGQDAPDAASHEDSGPALSIGEFCQGGAPTLRFDPARVVVQAGAERPVRVIVEPDLCSPTELSFTTTDGSVVPAPKSTMLDLRHPTYELLVKGGPLSQGPATATLTAKLPGLDGGPAGTASLPVTVNDGALPTCATGDVKSGPLKSSATVLSGAGGLADAALSVPPGAFERADELAIPPFTGTIACADDDLTVEKTGPHGHAAVPGALKSVGPAVTFSAGSPIDSTASLRRELDFEIPVNPARIPEYGRLRHLQVLFRSADGAGVTKTPVVMTIANPQIKEKSAGNFVLSFSSPWFGTYQAAFSPDAGTVTRTRHLTHRAIVGFSMGSAGAASFGFRHHDQFDTIAPLGGPSDWTWMFWFVEQYNLGGFCAHTDPLYPNCKTYAPNLWPIHETYAHSVDFNHWFFQDGGGNGGHFSRSSYAQIFGDLALQQGNPNGQNFDPTAAHPDRSLDFLPAGPQATDPWVAGNSAGLPGSCAVSVNPINPDPNPKDPSVSVQDTWMNQCTNSRCDPANTWISPNKYYDREYNPDGQFKVVSFCEGGAQVLADSPYEDVWAPPQPGDDYPMNVALAVDLNGNGVRDADEPVLRQGHEPWSDVGTDGLADVDEPGYDAVTNPDPDQDDYDFQRNPTGTEGDHHYEKGEPFLDYGLDGVKGTPQLRDGGYDYGEGDGVFTTSTGLANFDTANAHAILHQWTSDIPDGALTDDALLRLNVWADGGVRDLFNFGAVANHLVGSIASRKAKAGQKDAGTQLRSTAFYDGFQLLPGQDGVEADFNVNLMQWDDVVDAPSIRYGTIDATPAMIAAGDGQHVGTPLQLLTRLQTSIYSAVHQWPDADRTLTDTVPSQVPSEADASTDAGLGTNCPSNLCSFSFEADNRTGPVFVQLPPGYGLPANIEKDERYPVVFALHGYGQTPDGLEGAALVTTSLMNDTARSSATRLGKAILVYVDGRCRFSSDSPPQPECVEGSFYLNSDRPDNAHPGTKVAQFDAWFDDLITYIDKNFRTMPASDVEVTE